MGIFRQFPYSNFHEMNMDEILKIVKTMSEEWEETKSEWASYKDFIDNYFANLDVSEEVLEALRTLASTGELNTIIDPTIADATAEWLADNISPTTPAIDASLSVAGAGADAKVTGDDIRSIQNNKNVLISGNINSSGGEGVMTSRIKTKYFILIDEYAYMNTSNDYDVLAYAYDEDKTYIGAMPGWVKRYVMGRILREFPTAKYLRFVFRNSTTPNADITSEISTVYATTNWIKYSHAESSLVNGIPLVANDDLNNYTTFGNYYAATSAIASTILNAPTSRSFTLKISVTTGDDPSYIMQTVTDYIGNKFFRFKAGAADWSEWRNTRSSAPSMPYNDRLLLKNLATDYLDIRNNFTYNGITTRNDYYNSLSLLENGKFKIDCSTFAQLIFMGRSARDFDDPNLYTNQITKVFNWGYYFDFDLRPMAELQPDANNYYGFQDPLNLGDYSGSYSFNTYYSENSALPKKQVFNPFMFANDMARELDRKGYGIDISELQTGDLVFTTAPIHTVANTFAQVAYKDITHVAMVYEVGNDYIQFIEVFGSTLAITRCGTNFVNEYDKTRAGFLLNNIVFCARHPHAWEVAGNVPTNILQI